jgi:DNA-binding transcriptional ArsR family regulator
MMNGPDIASVGALIGDPARANIVAALMDGRALTSRELAAIAGITPQTASSHLAKLEEGGFLCQKKQGRNRYYSIASQDVAHLVEAVMHFAAGSGRLRFRPGPKDSAMRKARVCYDHLAGDLGVALFDNLKHAGHIGLADGELEITEAGAEFLQATGITLKQKPGSRRPQCRACLDWSERREHLAGAAGAAILQHIIERGWARRDPESRAILFSASGEMAFQGIFAANAAPVSSQSLSSLP